MDYKFNIPVVLFLFKRDETLIKTIGLLKEINASKIYLVGDGPRDSSEDDIIQTVRKNVRNAIDWECEVITDFAEKNRGVFSQIGEGAYRILSHEKMAIFLEDDNLPEKTFFHYCDYLLNKYMDDEKVLWVCGTNYLGKYINKTKDSYFFTRQLLPCGWASWGNKFCKYYDKTLAFLDDKNEIKKIKKNYVNYSLFKQQVRDSKRERDRFLKGKRFSSWDYHMVMSVVHNDLFGIAPCYNQIRNTGVDSLATHGGNNWQNKMALKLCGMPSYPLDFPLNDPHVIAIDKTFEKKISKIRLKPFFQTRIWLIKKWIREKIFHLDEEEKFSSIFKKK